MMKRTRLTAADRARIGDVYDAHRGFIEAVAMQQVGRDDAPDVVAEVGLRLCQSLNGLREPEAIRTWIYRVTVSAARDFHQARGRLARVREALTITPPDHAIGLTDTVFCQQRVDAFRTALDRLKSRDKRVICNSLHLDSVPVPSDGAARVALHRARQRLRETLLTDPRFTE